MTIEKAIEIIQKDKDTLEDYKIDNIDEMEEDVLEIFEESIKAIKIAIQALEKQLNNGWIPVSERLPEEYGCYLVAWRPTDLTDEDIIKNTGTVPHYYEIVEYDPDDEALWIGGIEQCDSYEILAWQPLPEPYKEVEI